MGFGIRYPAFGTVLLAACAPPPSGPPERVLIPPGASFAQALDSLSAHGLIPSRLWAQVVGRAGGFDRVIKPGLYEIAPGTSTLRILRDLRAGSYLTVRLTIPEGQTLMDIARLAGDRMALPAESLHAAAGDRELLERFGVEAPTAEGYLAAETYDVPAHYTARELVALMLEQFRRAWDPGWDSLVDASPLSRHEVITLASIVEGEAQLDEERPIIAGVYLNRLRIGMALQADPTVQYAIQRATGERKGRLYNQDYQFPSPYNTYRHPGLPPGPVGAPGRKSIEAVLRPATVPYLYFVAGPDGRHAFSRTYEEHLRAVTRARRERARSGEHGRER